jgi:Arc/MetJ family transcription regulator
MRTNIDIDDELMAKAMTLGGLKTKRETVHDALESYVQLKGQRAMMKLRGKINWIGDIDEMRRD